MSTASRRSVLAVAGTSTAAVAGTALAGSAAEAAGLATPERTAPRPSDPLVAYLADPRTGRVVLVSGESRTAVTDHALARSLFAATKRG